MNNIGLSPNRTNQFSVICNQKNAKNSTQVKFGGAMPSPENIQKALTEAINSEGFRETLGKTQQIINEALSKNKGDVFRSTEAGHLEILPGLGEGGAPVLVIPNQEIRKHLPTLKPLVNKLGDWWLHLSEVVEKAENTILHQPLTTPSGKPLADTLEEESLASKPIKQLNLDEISDDLTGALPKPSQPAPIQPAETKIASNVDQMQPATSEAKSEPLQTQSALSEQLPPSPSTEGEANTPKPSTPSPSNRKWSSKA